MCIRDRAFPVRLDELDAVVGGGDFVVGVHPDLVLFELAITTVFAVADGCLLYTSDAADERSSVDLGGRRIIKKKKKTEL